MVCDGVQDWVEPDLTSLANYEATEVSCDNLDNDCGGAADDIALADTPFMAAPGVCGLARQVCAGSGWQDPLLSTIAGYESPEESCDNLDNDCDGTVDTVFQLDPDSAQLECIGEYARTTPEKVLDGPWIEVQANWISGDAVSVSCALDDANGLHCWGDNEYSTLGGFQTALTGRQPNRITGDYKAFAVGGDAVLAIATDGTLWSWGRQLGGSNTDLGLTFPQQFGTANTWRSVSIGLKHACAVQTDDSLWCWGRKADGQLGPNITTYTPAEPQDTQLGAFESVSAGEQFTCGIRTDGTLWCWGANTQGGCGVDSAGADVVSPNQVVHTNGLDWDQVSAGSTHTCALDENGEAWCWGGNGVNSKLGNGDTVHTPVPQNVGTGPWTGIRAGKSGSCATSATGLWCWGSNKLFGLGLGALVAFDVPTQVDAALTTDGAVGVGYGCAIDGDGDLWCWGDVLERGSGPGPDHFAALSTAAIQDVAWGNFHGCYLDDADGSLWCVGADSDALLGDGSGVPSSTPVQVHAGPFVSLSHGDRQACAVTGAGQRYCWGENNSGGVGDGTQDEVATPTFIDDGPWRELYMGTGRACGIKTDESLWCWGGPSALSPALEGNAEVFSDLAVASTNRCGIRASDSEIVCWGSNTHGMLGQGSLAPQTVDYAGRVVLSEAGPWVDITSGDLHFCARKADDTVWCWGSDDRGQLGDGLGPGDSVDYYADSGVPSDVGGTWLAVEASGERTCGIEDDGVLYCWGYEVLNPVGRESNEKNPWPEWVDDGPFTGVAPSYARTCATRATYSSFECAVE